MTKPVAIVTGGSRGVGAEVSILLAKKGWNLAITCSSSMDAAKEICQDCETHGAETIVIQADVSQPDLCAKTVKDTIDKFGKLDALINNAGTTKFNAHDNLEGLSKEDFLGLYAINTVGPYMMIKESREYLAKSDNPSVVNVASIAGVLGIGSSVAYAASKGALINMTKSLARALGPIRVNAICPGFIQGDWLKNGLGEETYEFVKKTTEENVPLNLTCTAEQVAETICYFVESGPTITGETLLLDGGMHLGKY